MKKTYFKPQMKVIEILSVNMLALSGEAGSQEGVGKADTRSERNDWNNIWK